MNELLPLRGIGLGKRENTFSYIYYIINGYYLCVPTLDLFLYFSLFLTLSLYLKDTNSRNDHEHYFMFSLSLSL